MQTRRYELIVFDWDGTLMDSADTIVECLLASCRDIAVAPPTREAARHVIGLGLGEALASMLPDLPSERHRELVERYRTHFLSRDSDVPLFDGAAQTIADLHARGYRLAIATGKSRRGLDRALAQTGLGEFFHATRCADESASKPDPRMLNELLQQFDLKAQQALMIGDTTHDIRMAQQAHVDCVAVAHGAHHADDLRALTPLACLQSIAELNAWLNRYA